MSTEVPLRNKEAEAFAKHLNKLQEQGGIPGPNPLQILYYEDTDLWFFSSPTNLPKDLLSPKRGLRTAQARKWFNDYCARNLITQPSRTRASEC
jgi:hypothetical protein